MSLASKARGWATCDMQPVVTYQLNWVGMLAGLMPRRCRRIGDVGISEGGEAGGFDEGVGAGGLITSR